MTDTEVWPSGDRPHTESDRIVSRHSFSFGAHYDPGNLGFGVLIAHNEDVIQPGGGYPLHPHRDTEIVTWVLSGELHHADSSGAQGVTTPGVVQRLSAGTGLQHSELANDQGEPLHLVQMWVRPDSFGEAPNYAQADVASLLQPGELVPVASGLAKHRSHAAVWIRQACAGMSVARLRAGDALSLPTAPLLHVFVTRGAVLLETDGATESLGEGDAARVTRAQGEEVRAVADAEILVWELDSDDDWAR